MMMEEEQSRGSGRLGEARSVSRDAVTAEEESRSGLVVEKEEIMEEEQSRGSGRLGEARSVSRDAATAEEESRSGGDAMRPPSPAMSCPSGEGSGPASAAPLGPPRDPRPPQTRPRDPLRDTTPPKNWGIAPSPEPGPPQSRPGDPLGVRPDFSPRLPRPAGFSPLPPGWQEFCRSHARLAARDFARSYRDFMGSHPQLRGPDAAASFSCCFARNFTELFETVVIRAASERAGGDSHDASLSRRSSESSWPPPPSSPEAPVLGAPGAREGSRGDPLAPQAPPKAKPWQKFSLRSIGRSVRGLFLQSQGGGPGGEGSVDTLQTRLSRAPPAPLPQNKYEGDVLLLLLHDLGAEGGRRDPPTAPRGAWRGQPCRLLLRGDPPEGAVLELFLPPKAAKPRLSLLCAELVAWEEPGGSECCFFIQTLSGLELLLEAPDRWQRQFWLQLLGDFGDRRTPPVVPAHPPLEPEPFRRYHKELSAQGAPHPLARFPWFHDSLDDCCLAADLVMDRHPWAHGLFLVRQSETHSGDLVMTVNAWGKAKHLHLSVEDSMYRVQGMSFRSVSDAVDYFMLHPLPLRSRRGPVTLTGYVVASRHLYGEGGYFGGSDPSPPPFPPGCSGRHSTDADPCSLCPAPPRPSPTT